jgi:hypothetical protein
MFYLSFNNTSGSYALGNANDLRQLVKSDPQKVSNNFMNYLRPKITMCIIMSAIPNTARSLKVVEAKTGRKWPFGWFKVLLHYCLASQVITFALRPIVTICAGRSRS